MSGEGLAVVYLGEGFNATEVIGFVEAVDLVPGLRVKFVAEEVGAVMSDGGSVVLVAEDGYAEVEAAEILHVPGCRVMPLLENAELLQWVREIDAGTRLTTAMCVGRVLLGAAGLLEGRRVAAQPLPLPEDGSVEVHHRLVVDGKYVTGANATSAFDLGLYVASQYLTPVEARAAQFALEYDLDVWGPPFGERPLLEADAEVQAVFPRLMSKGSRPLILQDFFAPAES